MWPPYTPISQNLMQKCNLLILAIHIQVFSFHQIRQYILKKKTLWKGRQFENTSVKPNAWTKHFLQIPKANDYSQSKKYWMLFNKKYFWLTTSNQKWYFTPKKIDIALPYTLGFFVVTCLFTIHFTRLLISFSNLFTITTWSTFTSCF